MLEEKNSCIKMSVMSTSEQHGCRQLLKLLSEEDLLALSDTVTNRMISVESTEEAVDAIVAYSQSAEEFLKRKKVQRDVIFKYLAAEGVVLAPNIEKHQLVKKTLQLWSSDHDSQRSVNVYNTEKNGDGLSDLTVLGKQFCQWFYNLLNSQNPLTGKAVQDWGPQHFWKDAKLLLLSCVGDQQKEDFFGADLVSQRLFALVWEEKLLFCPNLEETGLKCLASPHGLVLVAVAGTIHRESVCLGIFEQVFGLIRDPLDENRWKVKVVHLKIKRQNGSETLPAVTYDSAALLQLFT